MKTCVTPIALGTIALITSTAGSAWGATLASYDFDGLDAAAVDPNVTASDLSDIGFNPDTNRNMLGQINGSVGNPSPAINGTFQTFGHNHNNLGLSVAQNVYIEFTLTPVGGVSIDYTDVTVDMQKDTSGGAAINASLLVDQDMNGFDTGDLLGSDSFANIGPWVTLSMDASALADTSDPTTFRIYFWTPGTGAGNGLNADNIVVNGDVISTNVIPSPTAALAGLVGLAGLGMRRRRK